jgi:hypothetical protein
VAKAREQKAEVKMKEQPFFHLHFRFFTSGFEQAAWKIFLTMVAAQGYSLARHLQATVKLNC